MNLFNCSPVHLCTQEPDPNKATLAKVIPTPNNGFAELVALQRDQVSLHINSHDSPGCLNWKHVLDLTSCLQSWGFDTPHLIMPVVWNQFQLSHSRLVNGSTTWSVKVFSERIPICLSWMKALIWVFFPLILTNRMRTGRGFYLLSFKRSATYLTTTRRSASFQ